MDKTEALRMNATALAWIGDAMYEIYVRKHVLESGARQADKLHTAGVRYVRASAQAAVMKELWKENGEVMSEEDSGGACGEKSARSEKIVTKHGKGATPELTVCVVAGDVASGDGTASESAGTCKVMGDDERSLVRRARNKKNATRPKNADPMDYKWATAFEALVGYLYMTEQKRKLEYVVSFALDMIESGKC